MEEDEFNSEPQASLGQEVPTDCKQVGRPALQGLQLVVGTLQAASFSNLPLVSLAEDLGPALALWARSLISIRKKIPPTPTR